MSAQTAPADRVSFARKLVYGLGAFVNNMLAAAIGGMLIVLNLGLGMNPALVGLVGALPRLTDAITDPLMGYISDNTRSRWGRRRPYIFIGAISAGLIYIALWRLPHGMSENFYFWFFLVGSIFFYLGYTIFATPWVALGYELTPDYHERTRLMGTQNFMGQLAYLVSPWFLAIMQAPVFDDMLEGARYLALAVGVLTILIGTMPAIFLRERFAHQLAALAEPARFTSGLKENLLAFFKGFAATLKLHPFLLLCIATFLVFNGFILVASFQSYVIIYYLFAGDTERGASYVGWAGMIGSISSFFVIILVTWLSSRIGKRGAFFVAMGVSSIGYALKWLCYNPSHPWLVLIPAPLITFGLGGLFTLMGSMVADVCDMDELQTTERREGMFGAIYWWVVKLGMSVAIAGGGFLLNATGFDVALGGEQSARTLFLMRFFDVGAPLLATLVAIWAIARFPITEEKASAIRQELEARRAARVEVDP